MGSPKSVPTSGKCNWPGAIKRLVFLLAALLVDIWNFLLSFIFSKYFDRFAPAMLLYR